MGFSTSQSTISRSPPSTVVYDLSEPYQTTITLPPGSTWSSELHWHRTHTEYLQVVQGVVQVFLEGKTQVVRARKTSANSAEADSMVICIPRYARHEWRRAPSPRQLNAFDDVNENSKNENAVVIERTDPADVEKSIFFRNLNGAILSAESLREAFKVPEDERTSLTSGFMEKSRLLILDIWLTLSLLVIFREFDNYPVFVNLHLPARLNSIGKNLEISQPMSFSSSRHFLEHFAVSTLLEESLLHHSFWKQDR